MNKNEFLVEKLNELFSHEYNSIAQYVIDSNPYFEANEEFALEELLNICGQERVHARSLGEMITSLDGLPVASQFPPSVADINYLSIEFGIDFVIRDKEDIMAHYEELIDYSKGFPEVRRNLLRMLEDEKTHLQILKNVKAKITSLTSLKKS